MTVPASAALIDVPSGTERLMPSFRSPFGLVPKLEMMRPLTGQRNCCPSDDGASMASAAGGRTSAALPGGSPAAAALPLTVPVGAGSATPLTVVATAGVAWIGAEVATAGSAAG